MGTFGHVRMSTLLQIAGGTMLVGASCIYLAHKHLQRKIRLMPHYRKAFKIIAEHEQAKNALGPPIAIGSVDLSDRRRNYVGEFVSELRIPISGAVDSGFMEIRAVRDSKEDEFETSQIELELERRGYRVIVYDDGRWDAVSKLKRKAVPSSHPS